MIGLVDLPPGYNATSTVPISANVDQTTSDTTSVYYSSDTDTWIYFDTLPVLGPEDLDALFEPLYFEWLPDPDELPPLEDVGVGPVSKARARYPVGET